ncbi:unnamed protein product [Symbiodinium sp. CCMP2592]|nr:unnamed protein product [Symbiodinium sp. CCMP2592]
MSAPPDGTPAPPHPGDVGGQSPGGAASPQGAAQQVPQGTLDQNVVLARLSEALAQLAVASTAQASAASGGQQEWRETKYVKSPEVFNPKSVEEEIAAWPEWAFAFKNFMAVQDDGYRSDFAKAESATEFLAFEDYGPALKARSLRLYSILASYLKGRALKILRADPKGDGFRVWRQLKEELQPTSRPRVLALAQALTRFPPLQEGASVLEYTLAYERLITEYEKLSPSTYPEDLNGVDKDSSLYQGNGPAPMDVDRVAEKGEKGKGAWKGKNAKGEFGKGKGKKGKSAKGYGGHKSFDASKGYKGYGYAKGKAFGAKGKDKGKKSSGKSYSGAGGKGKGPCFLCDRMGHRAAECPLRARVQQVVAEDDNMSVSTRATSVRRLELINNVAIEEIFDDDEAGEVGEQLWESHVHDLSRDAEEVWDAEEFWGDDWYEAEGLSDYVRMVAEIVEPAEHDMLDDSQSECGSSCSLPSTSTLHFSLCSEDDCDAECYAESGSESSWTVLQQAREAEEAELCVRAIAEGHEVILDSGADVTVLPMRIFGEVGCESKANVALVDAQGSRIPQAAVREGVTFVVEGCDGQEIVFRDRAVLARVKQPLLCAGKMFKDGWLPRPEAEQLVMKKGSQAFPVHWARNSLVATMKIFRTEEAQVRVVVELGESFLATLKRQGWQLNEDGQSTHVSESARTTVDPSGLYDPDVLPHRTTLVQKSGRRYSIFECGDCWEPEPVKVIGDSPSRVITILTALPVDPDSLGKVVAEEVAAVPRFPRPRQVPDEAGPSGEAVPGVAVAEPQQEQREPVLGPELREVPDVGEVVHVGDKTFREASTLKDLRWACKFLQIPQSGKKAVLWDRLKKEVAMSQLKVAVKASDAVIEAYTPDVRQGPLPVKPDAQTVMLHELTHIPRMDWCESCQAARSKEDDHPVAEPKRQVNVVSMDFMFNRTGDS